MRHDADEGMSGTQLDYGKGQTLAGIGWFGSEAYVFCTSTIEEPELIKKFKIGFHEEKYSPAILTKTEAAQFKQERQTA